MADSGLAQVEHYLWNIIPNWQLRSVLTVTTVLLLIIKFWVTLEGCNAAEFLQYCVEFSVFLMFYIVLWKILRNFIKTAYFCGNLYQFWLWNNCVGFFQFFLCSFCDKFSVFQCFAKWLGRFPLAFSVALLYNPPIIVQHFYNWFYSCCLCNL